MSVSMSGTPVDMWLHVDVSTMQSLFNMEPLFLHVSELKPFGNSALLWVNKTKNFPPIIFGSFCLDKNHIPPNGNTGKSSSSKVPGDMDSFPGGYI